jgi:hypothetical protein
LRQQVHFAVPDDPDQDATVAVIQGSESVFGAAGAVWGQGACVKLTILVEGEQAVYEAR